MPGSAIWRRKGKKWKKMYKKEGADAKRQFGGPEISRLFFCLLLQKVSSEIGLAKRGREIRVSIDACLELVMLHYTHTIPTSAK